MRRGRWRTKIDKCKKGQGVEVVKGRVLASHETLQEKFKKANEFNR